MKVAFIDIVHPALEEILTKNGFECVDCSKISPNDLQKTIHEYDGIVIRSRFRMDESFLKQATQLKFIARSGAGMENIDLDYCVSRGIKCYNSPEGNADAVGEHAIGMLLGLFNNLIRSDAEVRKGIWDREGNRGYELQGKTIGVIGYGNMGKSFAKKLAGFECTVLAHDKYKTNFSDQFVKEVELDEIYQQADIISLHLPLTNETKYYFNQDFIGKMKKPFYLINTARGKNANTKDLVNAMRSGKVLGACLDVLEYELSSFEKLEADKLPKPFQYLVKSDKVILSPHVAGWTFESYRKLSTFLAEKILKDFSK